MGSFAIGDKKWLIFDMNVGISTIIGSLSQSGGQGFDPPMLHQYQRFKGLERLKFQGSLLLHDPFF